MTSTGVMAAVTVVRMTLTGVVTVVTVVEIESFAFAVPNPE
jgi:hypothetical protein